MSTLHSIMLDGGAGVNQRLASGRLIDERVLADGPAGCLKSIRGVGPRLEIPIHPPDVGIGPFLGRCASIGTWHWSGVFSLSKVISRNVLYHVLGYR